MRNFSDFNDLTNARFRLPDNVNTFCNKANLKPEKCKKFKKQIKYFQENLKPDKGSYVSTRLHNLYNLYSV